MQDVNIVLVNTSHPGNIGAAARAMKNMGLSSLSLVAPEQFPHKEATVRASGADDLLAHAALHDDLPAALAECDWVFGASARTRNLTVPVCDAREAAVQIASATHRKVAIVFGRENSGLTNEELSLCHHHIHIPTVENFSSLNLAQAVQVVAYELRMTQQQKIAQKTDPEEAVANGEQLQGFYTHLFETMTQVNFLDPNHPKLLMRRMQRLFNRAEVSETEINILRGFLSAINRQG